MFGISSLSTYIIGTIAIIVLPGPNSLFCLSTAAKSGKKAGYQALLGILLGDSALIIATVFGAGSLLKLYPSLFFAIKILGGLYLAHLGFNLIKAGVRKWQLRHHSSIHITDASPTKQAHPFYHALLLSLTNPKAILFFLSFFVQFVEPTYPNPLLSFLILAIILQCISFLYLNVLIILGEKVTATFAKQHALASVAMLFVGTLFIGFALNLWMADL